MKTSRATRSLKPLLTGALLCSLAWPAMANATPGSKAKTDDPDDAFVIEEDVWSPWVYEPVEWFHNAESHYRHREEKAAASEIRKAESWLYAAASDAEPLTEHSLRSAAESLSSVAYDLEHGNVIAARGFDNALIKANKALADWHYFKARQHYDKKDEAKAAQNLQAASRYLKYAADSAGYEYGHDFITTYDELTGWTETETVPNALKSDLSVVRQELAKLGTTLKDVSGVS